MGVEKFPYFYMFAFCSLIDRPTGKIFIEHCSYMRGMCTTKKIRTLSQLVAEKIVFPPKPDGHTDGQTDGQT